MSIAAIHEFPATPIFLSSGRTCLARSVVGTATKLFFMTIVLLARKKSSAMHVLPDIGFEGPVRVRAKTRRRSRFTHRHNMKIYEVLVVARRVGLELSL